MTSHELYEATRGTWVVEERRHKAEYAFAVYRGVVMEVYVIEAWYPAGTTKYTTRVFKKTGVSDRWEFEGNIAEDAIRRKYVGQH